MGQVGLRVGVSVLVVTILLIPVPVFSQDAPNATVQIPAGCADTDPWTSQWWGHPLIRERWERALATANHTCVMDADGPVWDCYYSELLPDAQGRICFYPLPPDLLAGAPSRLSVFVDLQALRGLAERALDLGEIQQLIGDGASTVDVVVGSASARFWVDHFSIVEDAYLALPPVCTPFDPSAILGTLPADERAQWSEHAAATIGVCSSRVPPPAGQCEAIERVPDGNGYLCWWGLRRGGGADFRFDVAPDVLRSVLNADDSGAVAKVALARGTITIWSDDAIKRAAIRIALQAKVEDADLVPPPSDVGGTIALFGRQWSVSYFPRDGVLTPCARDGQGTWFWLNDFGVPNGFVGPSNIMEMKRFLDVGDGPPTDDELQGDLYLNYRPDAHVTVDGQSLPVEYVFVPGSPFSLLPVAKKSDGSFVRLNGDGTVASDANASESQTSTRASRSPRRSPRTSTSTGNPAR